MVSEIGLEAIFLVLFRIVGILVQVGVLRLQKAVRVKVLVAIVYVYAPLEHLACGGFELKVLVETGEYALNHQCALRQGIVLSPVWIKLLNLFGF